MTEVAKPTIEDWWSNPLYSDECSLLVVRKDEEQPCGKQAIAVAIYDGWEYEEHAFPVCSHHARGRKMMPLTQLIREIRDQEE